MTARLPIDSGAQAARPSRRSPHGCRGVTLLELMVAVVIVALLASVAYPSFKGQLQKGRRSDAVAALGALQLDQERYRATSATYASNLQQLGRAASTEGGHYSLSIQDATSSAYTLLATANAGSSQSSDESCARMAISYSNGTTQYLAGGLAGTLGVDSTRRCWPL